MRIINVRLSEEAHSRIDRIRAQMGLSRSEIVRSALLFYINLLSNIGQILKLPAPVLKALEVAPQKRGDLLVLKMFTGQVLVLGCTSSGGIGPKPHDAIKLEGYALGRFMTRPVLMDVLASGATPIALIATLAVEMNPAGASILNGVRYEAKKVGLDVSAIHANTEENIPTSETGLGLTALGIVHEDELRLDRTMRGDQIVAIGEPKVGEEVFDGERRKSIADVRDVLKLSRSGFIHDIIPVGSGGIQQSLRLMTKNSKYEIALEEGIDIDLKKSAGPATVFLATLKKEHIPRLQQILKKPLRVIGSAV